MRCTCIGGGADIIAVGVQEGDYTPLSNKRSTKAPKPGTEPVTEPVPAPPGRQKIRTKVSAAFAESDDEDDAPGAVTIKQEKTAAASTSKVTINCKFTVVLIYFSIIYFLSC